MIRKTYYIEGMHCIGCETFIERSVRKLKGINDVKVTLASSSILIVAESQQRMPSVDDLNQIFKNNGYSFTKFQQNQALQPKKYVVAIGIFF